MVLAYCHEMLIKDKMIVKKKIEKVEDEKEFPFDHKSNSN